MLDDKHGIACINKLFKQIYDEYAESLGGVETLITYPTTQTHADVPEELRLKNGITPETLRLSVGIESAEDLIKDLEEALK